MEAAKRWYKRFEVWIFVHLSLFFIGVMLPSQVDNIVNIVLKISSSILTVLIVLSVLCYYEWLLHRKERRMYKVHWSYKDKFGSTLFSGTSNSFIVRGNPTSDRDYIRGNTLSNFINEKRKHLLCNGTITVDRIEYQGKEYID